MHSTKKSQSAMEYLMTYGWAILIVAVVLAALFQLGVFSGVMSPRAQPGTCRVVRPMGVGTSKYASLQGVCTGLLPEYVAQFNKATSYIKSAQVTGLPVGSGGQMSVFMWVDTTGAPHTASDSQYLFSYGQNTANDLIYLDIRNGVSGASTWFSVAELYGAGINVQVPHIEPNQWYFIGFTLASNDLMTLYLNGTEQGTPTIAPSLSFPSGSPVYVSYWIHAPSLGFSLNGTASNIQIYNTTLSSNEVLALYKEGIGGAPIRVDALATWWPLNGNTNDTGGNLNNGVPTAVTYTSSWTSGYSLK